MSDYQVVTITTRDGRVGRFTGPALWTVEEMREGISDPASIVISPPVPIPDDCHWETLTPPAP